MNSRLSGIRTLLRSTTTRQRLLPAQALARPVTSLRRNATSATPTTTTTVTSTASIPKPKPNKSPSALKRTASASLPIRANPGPTRGAIQPIYTFTTAERYDLTRLRYALPESAVLFEDALWTPVAVGAEGRGDGEGEGGGEAWVFRNGTVVVWGTNEGVSRDFVDGIVRNAHTAQVSPLKMVETEELEFVIDPAETTRLQGDLIILGKSPSLSEPEMLPAIPIFGPPSPLSPETFGARYAFSQALARSTALSAFESSLDSYITAVERIPHALSETGEPGLPRKVLIKRLGQLLVLRQTLNLGKENFVDTPELYWREPGLEKYFVTMSRALEIPERMEALNRKIDYASEVQVTLRELVTESSAHRMELIIIWLITVEVVLAIIREGPDLWEMCVGSGDEKAEGHMEMIKKRLH